MRIWKVIIIKIVTLSILTKTLHKIMYQIWANKFRQKIMCKIKEHFMKIKVITNKKTTMKKIILKRLMNHKNLDKNKNKLSMLRKLKRTIVLMGKNTKKVIIRITVTVLMKNVKRMMKNFININSLSKMSQTSVTWTRNIRKKLLKSNCNKNTPVLTMVFQLSEVQKNNLRDLLTFLRNKLSHLLIPLQVLSKMLLHLLSIEKL